VPLVLAPLLPRFAALHPQVEVETIIDDRLLDVVAEGFDAGIRLDEFLERDMTQVRVSGPGRWVVVGAPAYLDQRGVPQTPRDLLTHDCLCFRSTTGAIYAWELERGKRTWRVLVRGPLVTNHIGVNVLMAEAGVGLAYAYEPAIADTLRRGSLRIVLEAFAPAVASLFLTTRAAPACRRRFAPSSIWRAGLPARGQADTPSEIGGGRRDRAS